NFAISKATGQWILILDADEVISPQDYEKLREQITPPSPPLTKGGKGGVIAYSFTTRNYVNQSNTIDWTANDGSYSNEEAGTGWFPGDKVRLFPNVAGVGFEYPVHERIEPSLVRAGIDIRRCDIPIHHYGKLDAKKTSERSELYFELGKKRLAEQGGKDITAMYDLAVQASEINKYEEAIEYLRKVVSAKPDFARAYQSMGNAYFNLRRYEDAIAAYRRATELDPDLRDAFMLRATSEIHAGNAEAAITLLENLLTRYPSYLTALPPLTVAHICTGRKDTGAHLLNNLRALHVNVAEYFVSFAQALMYSGKIPYAVALLLAAQEETPANEEIPRLLEECNKR
ncbi:MAG: tetratricopeptide repeat protein, partial [Nitrospirota bacterium]